jgi:hypothetical protein
MARVGTGSVGQDTRHNPPATCYYVHTTSSAPPLLLTTTILGSTAATKRSANGKDDAALSNFGDNLYVRVIKVKKMMDLSTREDRVVAVFDIAFNWLYNGK